MTAVLRCKDTWQVEAARDGRLGVQEARAFEHHLASCPDCAREQAQLEALTNALRAPQAETSAIELRALRERVLTQAATGTESPTRVWLRGRTGTACAVAAIALCIGYLGAHWAPVSSPSKGERRAALVLNEGPGGASWTRHHTAQLDTIDLHDGSLRVNVKRQAEDPRVLVQVPEGEIEDFGTVFTVTVRAGKTSELSVDEGRVLWKRRGEPAMMLAAGMSWKPSAAVAPAAVSAPEPVIDAGAPKHSAPQHVQHVNETRAASASAANDAAAEDAAYLQLMALLREHRDDEARLAAAKYLKSFPKAFRRKEVAATMTPR